MSSLQIFFICVLKRRKVLRIKIIFYTTGQKIRYKKTFVEVLNRYKKQEVVRKKSVCYLENDSEKILE